MSEHSHAETRLFVLTDEHNDRYEKQAIWTKKGLV